MRCVLYKNEDEPVSLTHPRLKFARHGHNLTTFDTVNHAKLISRPLCWFGYCKDMQSAVRIQHVKDKTILNALRFISLDFLICRGSVLW